MNLHPLIATQASGSNPMASLGLALPLVLMFGIFYLLLILPQQRRQKKWQQMLGSLKTGDKVVTSGGIRGSIISLKDDFLTLRVPPDNLRIEVSRSSIVSLTTADETTKAA